MSNAETPGQRWYQGITRYQWTVLTIASLGWMFDVFESQIFVASMHEAMPELLPPDTPEGDQTYYENISFAAFLLGGALGGILFGRLSDRIGRVRTLIYTILLYSSVTCISALSQTWWHMAVTRFFVGMGTGGEWAVGAALVAEVFPKRARAWSLAIFHGSSVFGTLMAVAAGAFLVPNFGWRMGFVLGALPALLVLWVRLSLKEPPKSAEAAAAPHRRLAEIFQGRLLRHSLIGVSLATVGLATFWGVHVRGKDYLRELVEAAQYADPKSWEMMGMMLATVGGGIGLFAFGPLADRLGRRGAFLFFHIGALASALILFQLLTTPLAVLICLPIFGFLTLGMHAGYAVYFPELFPTALRSTGAGFCFNVGRLFTAPIIIVFGWMNLSDGWGLSRAETASLLSLLFLVGIMLLPFAMETRGRDLPE